MATVDIEPASLAVTPGESELLTLTVRNDGDDVEAYHLTVVDDAAGYVVIEPDTLLVHPGETVTATATLTLAHTGKWQLGDLIVRFHIVPAGQPGEFLVVEAIATIQSFSDVAAVLSPPGALEGRRSAAAEVTIANAGNAHTYAEVSASAGELAVFIDQPHAALPAGSTERIGLTVRARSLLWRGEPVQDPFVVTVTPEGGQAISLEGTFTQLPIFARWALAAAISVGAVAVAAVLVWVAVAVAGGGSGPSASETASASATPSKPPQPEPDVRIAIASPASDAVKAGDDVSFTLRPDVEGAPEDSLLAMEVTWPEGLLLTSDECEAWVAPDGDRALEGRPRSGDECITKLSGAGTDATLTFATPPAGLVGAVSVEATRLVTLDDSTATTLETGPDSDFGDATEAFELSPYPFWLQVEDLEPSDRGPDARVTIHHVMRGDGTDPETTLAFEVGLPGFAGGILDTDLCDARAPGSTTCSIDFDSNADDETNSTHVIDMWFDIDDAGGVGPVTLTGTSVDGVAPPEDVNQWVRGAEGLLVSESLFNVDVTPLDVDEQPGQSETVTATIKVSGNELPAEVETYSGGSWDVALELAWPEGLVLVEQPDGCTLVDRLCTLPPLATREEATITMRFDVEDYSGGREVRASGNTLRYDPTTDADARDGRTQPFVSLPPHWIGSDAERLPF